MMRMPHQLAMLAVLVMSCSTPAENNDADSGGTNMGGENNGTSVECSEKAECADFQEWAFPEQVRCESGSCVECQTMAECGEEFRCSGRRCVARQTCETAVDCERPEGTRGGGGCAGGYCGNCELDEHCAAEEFCAGRPGDPSFCYALANVGDPRCADDTCPGQCGFDADDLLQCRVERYPGVDIPEPGDYSVACEAVADCALVELLMFTNETCECTCFQIAVASSARDEYVADLPETKVRYGCEAEPDCACDATTTIGCVNDRCEVEE